MKRRKHQVWFPAVVVGTLIFFVLLLLLPFLSVKHLSNNESKVVDNLSTFAIATTAKDPSGATVTANVTTSSSSLRQDTELLRPSPPLLQKQVPADTDGTFNGIPIYYKETPFYSSVHCIGETFQNQQQDDNDNSSKQHQQQHTASSSSWIHRSCHYQHLCLDLVEKEFVLFQSPHEASLQTRLSLLQQQQQQKQSTIHNNNNNDNMVYISSHLLHDNNNNNSKNNNSTQHNNSQNSHNDIMSVAIGGINAKWSWRPKTGIPRLQWSPTVLKGRPFSYYELDDNVIWIPFHSMAGFNPGHLVWDDWLPIYTLLETFQLVSTTTYSKTEEPDDDNDDSRRSPTTTLLLMRYVLPGQGLWATCDYNDEKKHECQVMFEKFLPLMGVPETRFTTNHDFNFQRTNNHTTRVARYVCAKHGLAGIGMLTDHGQKLHGWSPKDYTAMHNHGRAKLLWDFRQFMVRNLFEQGEAGISENSNGAPSPPPPPPSKVQGAPFYITFSINSSESGIRSVDFAKQIQTVQSSIPNELVRVRSYDFKTLSLSEQVRVAAETAMFVTACGGGAVTATFLPRGASLLLYYDATGGVRNNKETGTPARLDWDLFNNVAYVRVHWLPTATMDTNEDVKLLVAIVQHELDILKEQNVD